MEKRLRTREPDFSDRLRYIAMILATLAPMVIVMVVAQEHVLYALPVMIVLLAALIWWHAENTAYRCEKCGHEFVVSAWKDAFSPHMLESKYLKCPGCGRRSWAKALVRER
jgi:DNA-directed RNA polymerase subunit RPC12/RpoP